MVQAAVLDSLQFDASPFGQDGFATTKIDVSRGEVADALVVAVVVVVVDEGGDGCFAFAWSAPIEWSNVNVSAWSASGLSGRCFWALEDGILERCAV